MRGVDGDARLDEAKAVPAGVDDDVGAEAGADHGDTLGSSLQQVGQELELPVLAETVLPGGQRLNVWPAGSSEEVRDDAGQSQLLRHGLAILLGPPGVRTEDIVAPHQPFPTQRGTKPERASRDWWWRPELPVDGQISQLVHLLLLLAGQVGLEGREGSRGILVVRLGGRTNPGRYNYY